MFAANKATTDTSPNPTTTTNIDTDKNYSNNYRYSNNSCYKATIAGRNSCFADFNRDSDSKNQQQYYR